MQEVYYPNKKSVNPRRTGVPPVPMPQEVAASNHIFNYNVSANELLCA